MSQYDYSTRLIHNKHAVEEQTGAVSVPIYHSSTFHQRDVDQLGRYDYGRSGNPTREALEDTVASLEGGCRGFAFSSGMAAISSAFLLCSKGDHVLVCEDVYGGTYRLVTGILERLGIEYTFVDMTDLEQVKSSILPHTKVLYIETPSNPLLKITDIEAVCALAKEHGCLTYVDNTFLTSALQQPLQLGADVVLYSATKFMAGHSDVVAGLAVVRDEALAEQFSFVQNTLGGVLGVQDCWLVLRGLKTLHVRLQHAQQTAERIAKYLLEVPFIKDVYYPGLEGHPGADVHKRQSHGPGAVLSFCLKDAGLLSTFVKALKIPVFAVSLGAVESILSYPAVMSHASMPPQEREKRGIGEGLLRLSAGLEQADDLIRDFEQAFQTIQAKEKV